MSTGVHIPKISVLLPIYNAESYLRDCLDSILNQTFQDFEVIALNDASTDSSLSILEQYAQRDARIKIFCNSSNQKLAATLNKGLKIARSSLIARMDADDIAFPRRLECQYDFMQCHPEVAVCGTGVQVLGTDTVWTVSENDALIRAEMFFYSPLLHPTVIYRKHIICQHGGYSTKILYAQDFELWHRLGKDPNIIFANINIPFLFYRITDADKHSSYKIIQTDIANNIRKQQLELLGLRPTDAELKLHNTIALKKNINTFPQLISAYRWLRYLAKLPDVTQEFRDICQEHWRYICRESSCKPISYPLYLLLPPSKEKWKMLKKRLFAKK